MAKTTAWMVATVAMLTTGAALEATSGPRTVVVLHVTDFAQVSSSLWAQTKQEVTQVYDTAGVRVVWADGPARSAPPDGTLHLDVLLLSQDMVARKIANGGITQRALGSGSRPTRRAYIFSTRISEHARRSGCPFPRLLAAVIAHEVGHLLLPTSSHSRTGIMRGSLEEFVRRVPDFTVDQGTTIRALLVSESTATQ